MTDYNLITQGIPDLFNYLSSFAKNNSGKFAKNVLVPAVLWAGLVGLTFGGFKLYKSRDFDSRRYDRKHVEDTKEHDFHVIKQGRQSEHYRLEDGVGISLSEEEKKDIERIDYEYKANLKKRSDNYTNASDSNVEDAVDKAKKAFSKRKIEFNIPEKPTKKEKELIPPMESINRILEECDSIIKSGGKN